VRLHIEKSVARGRVQTPPSKSLSHRLLLAAGLTEGESTVCRMAVCEDTLATLDCLRALGADCRVTGNTVFVRGVTPDRFAKNAVLPCRESGSALRFLIPVCLLSGNTTRFTGTPRLFERPLEAYADLCRLRGLPFVRGTRDLSVRGPLLPGHFTLPGDVTSQYVSGLLFALPLQRSDSLIRLSSPPESRPYIDMTLSALSAFGVRAAWENPTTLLVPGGQRYVPASVTVDGDATVAAVFAALNALGGSVEITGLSPDTKQGDRVFADCFAALAAGAPTLSLADCPDLAPVLFVTAALLHGATFTDTKRLAFKESDRAHAMAEELAECGASITVRENSVTVEKVPLFAPVTPLSAHGDHRVAMALAVLLTALGGDLDGCEHVSKSCPDFFQKLSALGVGVTPAGKGETL